MEYEGSILDKGRKDFILEETREKLIEKFGYTADCLLIAVAL